MSAGTTERPYRCTRRDGKVTLSFPTPEAAREYCAKWGGTFLNPPAAATGACSECGGTKLGDDGYECRTCEPAAVRS